MLNSLQKLTSSRDIIKLPKSLDVWNIALKNRDDLFEWLVIPFGLTNETKFFIRYMDYVIIYIVGKMCHCLYR